jgi:hypothetical protein
MRTVLVGAALVLTTSGAIAQEIIPYNDYFVSSKTRPEVRAEAASAQPMSVWDRQNEITRFTPMAAAASVNGADVRKEGLQAERTSARDTVYDMNYQY